MKTITPLIIIALAGLAALPAAAATPGSDRRFAASSARDARQDQRIAAGIASGAINPREAARLDTRNRQIGHFQARLASDGFYSRRDRARVGYRQNSASRGIHRARYNRY